MDVQSRLEARVAALISAYADRAPVDVDPIAMTRLTVTGPARGGWPFGGFVWAVRGPLFALLLVALLVALVAGTLVAGGNPFRHDPARLLTGRAPVEPFVGLPPEGATPSTPEHGDLVLSFGGRVHSIGLNHHHRVWVYEDGRLIWVREQRTPPDPPGLSSGFPAAKFPAANGPRGVIEQRLTPAGVELMRTAAVGATLRDLGIHRPGTHDTRWGLPGVLWGELGVTDGQQVHDVTWGDGDLPGRLADPASWLPADAWADQRIGAYMPMRYEVCGWPAAGGEESGSGLELLPDPARQMVETSLTRLDPADPYGPDAECRYQATAEAARAIAATLDETGVQREVGEHSIGYRIGEGVTVFILPVLPDGEAVCECG